MKKTCFLVVLIFLLASAGAWAEPIALNMQGQDALVTREGEVLIPPEKYAEIYAVGGGYFALGIAEQTDDGFSDMRYALADDTGAVLTEAVYSYLEYCDGVIYFEMDGRFGAMDENLSVLIPCEYTHLMGDGEGGFVGFLALQGDPWDTMADAVYVLDNKGAQRETDISVIDLGGVFSEGLVPALHAQTQKYGYLNAAGEWMIEPQFLYADAFSGGLARASASEGIGIIDEKGEWVLPPRYDAVECRGETLIVATLYGEGVFLFDRQAKEPLAQFSGEEIYAAQTGDFAVIYSPDAVFLVDAQGKTLLSCAPQASIFTGERRAVVTEGADGQDGVFLYDFEGNRVSEAFDMLTCAGVHGERELFVAVRFVREDGPSQKMVCGLADECGEMLLPFEYDRLYAVDEDRFYAKQGNSEGMIDASGRWIVRFGGDS